MKNIQKVQKYLIDDAPTFISLFAGCGGLDLGFIQAGFCPVAAYDNWQLAVENYRRNIGDHAALWDLSKGYIPQELSCDVVLSGSPCQGFSTVGKRKLDDPRNSLLHSAVGIAINLRPKVAVFENVPGVLQGGHKVYWDLACESLEREGYKTTTLILDARNTGVPQTRKRVFLIAHEPHIEMGAEIEIKDAPSLMHVLRGVNGLTNHEPKILMKGSVDFKIAQKIGQGQKLCNVRAGEASIHTWNIPEVFGDTSETEREILNAVMRLRRRIRTRDFGDADPVQIADIEAFLGRAIKRGIKSLIKKGFLRKVDANVDLCQTFNGKYRRVSPHAASFTVDSKFGQPRYFLHPVEDRGFSVREAARIQGFPDSYVFHGAMDDQYKLVANAVPPTMGGVVGKMVMNAIVGGCK